MCSKTQNEGEPEKHHMKTQKKKNFDRPSLYMVYQDIPIP